MQHIELDDKTAQNLAAQAAARGLTVADCLRLLVPPLPDSDGPPVSLEELDAELAELAVELPTLPRDFSRADIYTPEEFVRVYTP